MSPLLLGAGKYVDASKGEAYSAKVLGIAPDNIIAYWPLSETSGSVADNLERTAARDGAYANGYTLAATGIGDGRTSVALDGIDGEVQIPNAVGTAMSVAEGTLFIWLKVSGSGVWTDAATRHGLAFAADGTNYIRFYKSGGDNQFFFEYEAGDTQEFIGNFGYSNTSWFTAAITWSVAGDIVVAYLDGVSQGNSTVLGTFSGDPAGIQLGNGGIVFEDQAWDGNIAHAAVWNTPLTEAQLLNLSSV